MAGTTDTVSGRDSRRAGIGEGGPRMWRAAWRQHRVWLFASLALVAAGAVVLPVIVAIVPGCASTNWWETPGATCDTQLARILWGLYRLAMQVLPILVGALLGALTFGPDVEHRTQVYSLTQGVTRIRWWAVKVSMVAGPVFLAVALLGLANQWVVTGADDSVIFENRLTVPGFDIIGLTPATRFLLAYAAAALAALIWRTIGGLVAGLIAAALIAFAGGLLQPYVVPHQRDLIPIQQWMDPNGVLTERSDAYYSPLSAYGWSAFADADGHELDVNGFDCQVDDWFSCLQDNGVVYHAEIYVADSTYPQMMLTMSGINILISGGLFALGARRIRRHDV